MPAQQPESSCQMKADGLDKHYLGVWQISHEGFEFQEKARLTRDQFMALNRDLDRLQQCDANVFFGGLKENLTALKGLIVALDSRSRIPPNRRELSFDKPTIQRRFGVSIANFLSSARTYTDATSSVLSRFYGADSPLLGQFRASLSEQFDTRQEYRFCEKLRNAFQHTGHVPISLSQSHDQLTESITHHLVARREELLRSFDWGAKVTEDLKNAAEEIDILHAILEYYGCLLHVERQRMARHWEHETATVERVVAAFRAARCDPEENTVVYSISPNDVEEFSSIAPRFSYKRSALERILKLIAEDGLQGAFLDGGSPDYDGPQIGVTTEAHEIMLSWLASGAEGVTRTAYRATSNQRDALSAVVGLVNIAGVALSQVEYVLGNSPFEFLKDLTSSSPLMDPEKMDEYLPDGMKRAKLASGTRIHAAPNKA